MFWDALENRRLWWPLVLRVGLWSLATAISWGWLPFLCGGELGLFALLSPDAEEYTRDSEGKLGINLSGIFVGIVLCTTICLALGGAIAGALMALFAPSEEPHIPYQSPVFQAMKKPVFWRSLCGNFAAISCLSLFEPILRQYVSVLFLILYPMTVIAIIGFVVRQELEWVLLQRRKVERSKSEAAFVTQNKNNRLEL